MLSLILRGGLGFMTICCQTTVPQNRLDKVTVIQGIIHGLSDAIELNE